MSDIYACFCAEAQKIASEKISDWKSGAVITDMLEHEPVVFAKQYVLQLQGKLCQEEIQFLVAKNDRFGGSQRQNIGPFISSPSSMRYVIHSYEILSHILSKKLKKVAIVEVGGGYGGLSLVLQAMAERFDVEMVKYYIYDLPEVQLLQKYYTALNRTDKNIVWLDSGSFGADLPPPDSDCDFVLVSNYCMSEIPPEFRRQYLANLLPRMKAVYMRWNLASTAELPSTATIIPEVPNTGRVNKVIYI